MFLYIIFALSSLEQEFIGEIRSRWLPLTPRRLVKYHSCTTYRRFRISLFIGNVGLMRELLEEGQYANQWVRTYF
jgi:hypothetical protein